MTGQGKNFNERSDWKLLKIRVENTANTNQLHI